MSEEEKYLPTTIEKVFEALDKRVISLGVPGLFGSLAIAKAGENKWNEAGLCLVAAAGIWVVIQVGKKLAPKLDKLLDWGLGFVESSGQRIWAIATDRFQGQYYQRLIYDCREYEGRGFNAGALRLDQVYVPLRLTQCSADGAGQNLIRRYDVRTEQQDIGQMLEELSRKDSACCRLVILGAPGSGKSTLLRHLTLMYASHRQRKLGRRVPKLIPVLVRLRAVYQWILDNPKWGLVDLIEQSVKDLQKTEPLKVRNGWFGKKLRDGRCLVMLDGLDEIPEDGDRIKVSAWVDEQLKAYPKSKFILTSRPDAYGRSPLRGNAIESEVQPLARPDRDVFIRNWCGNWRKSQSKKKPDLGDRDKIERAALDLIAQIDAIPALRLMSTNPLLLVLMAKTYSEKGALSKRRVDIYRDVCQVLLEGRSRIVDVPSGGNSGLSYVRKQAILQVLALEMTRAERLQFTLTNVSTHLKVFTGAVDLLDEELAKVPNNQMVAKEFIGRDEVGARELVSEQQQEGIYEFAHKTFQEYLAASEIKRLGRPEILCEVFAQGDEMLSWWREVILFYAAQADATPIVEAAFCSNEEKGNYLKRLILAHECLEVTESIDRDLRQRLEATLEKGLQSDDFATFQFSVSILLNARLQRLNPDGYVEINSSSIARDELYDDIAITEAEYQLFLCEIHLGRAHSPISVPRAAHKHEPSLDIDNLFCHWLMVKTEQQFAQTSICYRPQWKNDTLYVVRFYVPCRYYPLAKLLVAGEWQQADQETYKLMITNPTVGKKMGDLFNRADLENFPCEDLLTIDHLWVEASNGHFGFSVQKTVWQKCGGPMDCNDDYEKFMEEVGWRSGGSYVDYEDLKFSTSNSFVGELPLLVCGMVVGLGSLLARSDLEL